MRWNLKRHGVIGAAGVLVLGGLALALLGAGGIAAWEYSNSNQFCATMCHSVHPEETRAHGNGPHARVDCVECHMGRISTLHMMALKPTHFKELWGMVAGYDRPLTSHTFRPSRDNCEGCHWPEAEHHDSISVKKRYDTDPKSSETVYRLVLHTGMGTIRDSIARGIHWHIENEVNFVTTDPQRRVIPWVQVKGADGKLVTYVDAESKLTDAEMKKLEVRRMECYDCHNQAGHPFPNPEDQVDHAIATGRIDRSLPNTKARAVALIEQAKKLTGPHKEMGAKIEKLIADAAPKGEMKPEMQAKEKKFREAMKQILVDSSFSTEGLSWASFPNHVAHKDFPGCFRCHNGKHVNEQGQAIRLQCTLCHNLPQVEREAGKGSVPSTVVAGLTPPPTHEEPNFMHDHRTKLDDTCESCHGKIEWGADGGSFCSNPACHGRKWPGMNLDPQARK
jgi:nitrate/TMAO reductase-like tetraheme cytochrome c subunit